MAKAQQKYSAGMVAAGMIRISIWVPEEKWYDVREYAARLREEHKKEGQKDAKS